jgi:hypothetical protein
MKYFKTKIKIKEKLLQLKQKKQGIYYSVKKERAVESRREIRKGKKEFM